MDNIVKLYNEHLITPFSAIGIKKVMGIDLAAIDNDTTALIGKYIDAHGYLGSDDTAILHKYNSDLKTVVRELSGADKQRFSQLKNMAGLVIERLKNELTCADKESFRPEWNETFFKIREILNEWDPLGVADLVDDEYDTMNFRTLSILINKRDKNEIREILADYTKNSMGLNIDSTLLDLVSNKISQLSQE